MNRYLHFIALLGVATVSLPLLGAAPATQSAASARQPASTQPFDETKIPPLRPGCCAVRGTVTRQGIYSLQKTRPIQLKQLFSAAGLPQDMEHSVVRIYPPAATQPSETLSLDQLIKDTTDDPPIAKEQTTYVVALKNSAATAPTSRPAR